MKQYIETITLIQTVKFTANIESTKKNLYKLLNRLTKFVCSK